VRSKSHCNDSFKEGPVQQKIHSYQNNTTQKSCTRYDRTHKPTFRTSQDSIRLDRDTILISIKFMLV